jgi:hypothetical protein
VISRKSKAGKEISILLDAADERIVAERLGEVKKDTEKGADFTEYR